MNVRQVIIAFIGVVILAAGVMLNKKLSVKEEPVQRPAPPTPEKLVESIKVENGTVDTKIPVFGKITAAEKLDIFSEVSGLLVNTTKPFRKGTRFSKGDLLFSVDDREQRLSLQAQKATLMNAVTQMMPDLKLDYPQSFAQWQAYLDQFDPNRSIKELPEPVNEKEKYFVSSRNIYTQFFNIKSVEVRLTRYNVYAPFSGVLTQSSVNPGTVIRASQKLGELMNTGSYELEATVSLADLSEIRVGQKVKLISEDVSREWTGRVRRISESIDANTQSAIVYIGVSGRELKENMYLRGNVDSKALSNVFEIPRKLLIDDNQVYAIKNGMLSLQKLKVVRLTETTAIVEDLPNGIQLLAENFPGTREGMKVKLMSSEKVMNNE